MKKKVTFLSIAIILAFLSLKVNGQVKYPYPFNPEKGLIDASEQQFR